MKNYVSAIGLFVAVFVLTASSAQAELDGSRVIRLDNGGITYITPNDDSPIDSIANGPNIWVIEYDGYTTGVKQWDLIVYAPIRSKNWEYGHLLISRDYNYLQFATADVNPRPISLTEWPWKNGTYGLKGRYLIETNDPAELMRIGPDEGEAGKDVALINQEQINFLEGLQERRITVHENSYKIQERTIDISYYRDTSGGSTPSTTPTPGTGGTNPTATPVSGGTNPTATPVSGGGTTGMDLEVTGSALILRNPENYIRNTYGNLLPMPPQDGYAPWIMERRASSFGDRWVFAFKGTVQSDGSWYFDLAGNLSAGEHRIMPVSRRNTESISKTTGWLIGNLLPTDVYSAYTWDESFIVVTVSGSSGSTNTPVATATPVPQSTSTPQTQPSATPITTTPEPTVPQRDAYLVEQNDTLVLNNPELFVEDAVTGTTPAIMPPNGNFKPWLVDGDTFQFLLSGSVLSDGAWLFDTEQLGPGSHRVLICNREGTEGVTAVDWVVKEKFTTTTDLGMWDAGAIVVTTSIPTATPTPQATATPTVTPTPLPEPFEVYHKSGREYFLIRNPENYYVDGVSWPGTDTGATAQLIDSNWSYRVVADVSNEGWVFDVTDFGDETFVMPVIREFDEIIPDTDFFMKGGMTQTQQDRYWVNVNGGDFIRLYRDTNGVMHLN